MFLFDWFYGILTFLGLWQKEAKILFLGHDMDLKRLLLGCFEEKRLVEYQRGNSTSEELSIGKINFKVFDLGSHRAASRFLRDYNAKVDAVVYLVEPYDWWFAESKRELDALLSDESLANVPILIFAAAYRLLGAGADDPFPDCDESLLYDLGLTGLTTGKGMVNLDANVRPLELFICSNFRGHRMAHRDGFVWLAQYIN